MEGALASPLSFLNVSIDGSDSDEEPKGISDNEELIKSSDVHQMICINHQERRLYLSTRELCAASNTIETLLFEKKMPYDKVSGSYLIDISSEKLPIECATAFVNLCRLESPSVMTDNDKLAASWKALPLIKKFDCVGLRHLIFSQIKTNPKLESIAMYDRLFQPTWPRSIHKFVILGIQNDRQVSRSVLKHFSKNLLVDFLFTAIEEVHAVEDKHKLHDAEQKKVIEGLQQTIIDNKEKAKQDVVFERNSAKRQLVLAKERAMERFVQAKKEQEAAILKAKEQERQAQIALEATKRAEEELQHQEAILKQLQEKSAKARLNATKQQVLAENAKLEFENQARNFTIAQLSELEINRISTASDLDLLRQSYNGDHFPQGLEVDNERLKISMGDHDKRDQDEVKTNSIATLTPRAYNNDGDSESKTKDLSDLFLESFTSAVSPIGENISQKYVVTEPKSTFVDDSESCSSDASSIRGLPNYDHNEGTDGEFHVENENSNDFSL